MSQLDEYLLPHFALYCGALRMTDNTIPELSSSSLRDFYIRIHGKADLTDTTYL